MVIVAPMCIIITKVRNALFNVNETQTEELNALLYMDDISSEK